MVVNRLNKHNFNDIVQMLWSISQNKNRDMASRYVKDHNKNVFSLSINGETLGVYIYADTPNTYTLNYFILSKTIRMKKAAYLLYEDMKKRLRNKPVIVPVYSDNTEMISIVKKRGKFLSIYPGENGKTIEYYHLDFRGEEWNAKKE